MKYILFFLFGLLGLLFISTVPGIAQGGWDIVFFDLDSLSREDIGRDLKLDFKNPDTKRAKPPQVFIQRIVSPSDTATIQLDGREITLVEKRRIHVDWGFYNECYLECPDYGPFETLQIHHTIIEDIKEDSIQFKCHFEVYHRNKKEKLTYPPRRFTKKIWIKKEQLNGLLIKQDSKAQNNSQK